MCGRAAGRGGQNLQDGLDCGACQRDAGCVPSVGGGDWGSAECGGSLSGGPDERSRLPSWTVVLASHVNCCLPLTPRRSHTRRTAAPNPRARHPLADSAPRPAEPAQMDKVKELLQSATGPGDEVGRAAERGGGRATPAARGRRRPYRRSTARSTAQDAAPPPRERDSDLGHASVPEPPASHLHLPRPHLPHPHMPAPIEHMKEAAVRVWPRGAPERGACSGAQHPSSCPRDVLQPAVTPHARRCTPWRASPCACTWEAAAASPPPSSARVRPPAHLAAAPLFPPPPALHLARRCIRSAHARPWPRPPCRRAAAHGQSGRGAQRC